MRVVTQVDIKEMNQLYAKLKTYAAVARATGFSPSTVKRYIINGYQPVNETAIIHFDRPLPELDCTKFYGDDWGDLCKLSDEELEEIKELWKEIEI